MNHPFLLPPSRLDQPFDGENEGGGGAMSSMTRRKFLKRSGGATVAAFVAWNITANSAKAQEEEGVGGSSYLMRINNIEPESGAASQIRDQIPLDDEGMVLPSLDLDELNVQINGSTLVFSINYDYPDLEESPNVTYVEAFAKLLGVGVNVSTDEKAVIHTFESFKVGND
jgi:hypothetical protein